MEPNRIFSADQIIVPPDLPEVLKNWTKEVIRNNPSDPIQFSYDYFQACSNAKSNNKLSAEELASMKKLFDQYDVNGDGNMETKELKSFITLDLGFEISDEDLDKVIKILDADGSGLLEFDEIVQWWSGQC